MPEIYAARFATSLTATTGTTRPVTLSVASTQAGFAGGTFSIAIFDAGTDANPTNYEVLEVTSGGGTLFWTANTEAGWGPFAHATGSTVIATVLTPRSLQEPLLEHTTPTVIGDPHPQYVNNSSYSAAGDLQVGTGASAYTRLPVGADGTVPIAASTAPGGIRWGIPGITTVLQQVGDLIVGGFRGLAQRLAVGTYGQVLSVGINASVVSDPAVPPVVTAGTVTGTFTPGSLIDVAYAWSTGFPPNGGATLPSPVTVFTVTSTGSLQVQIPAAPRAATLLIIYTASHGGTLVETTEALASTTSPNVVTVSSPVVFSGFGGSGTEFQGFGSVATTNTTGGFGPQWTSFGSTFTSFVQGTIFSALGITGQTQASRFMGSTTSGPPTAGTYVVADYVIDQTGNVWICTVAGTPGTWLEVGATVSTFSGEVSGTDFLANGVAGTSSSRFVGATVGGPPVSGSFLVGDFVIDKAGFGAWVCITAGSPGTWIQFGQFQTGEQAASDFRTNGLTGATAATRWVGGTATGAPTTGVFVLGDWVTDQTGRIWMCITGGSPGTWVLVAGGTTFSTEVSAPDFKPTGLTGAVHPSRYVGAVTSGAAPTSGTFSAGDFVIDTGGTPAGGSIWLCITGGSPGTWSQIGGLLNSQLVKNGSVAGTYTAAGTNSNPLDTSIAARFIGGYAGAPPGDGSSVYNVRDFVVDTGGTVWVCTAGGVSPTWKEVGHVTGGFTTQVSGTDFAATGVTGVSSARFVGGTASGAPSTGTFLQGDMVVDKTGLIWVCTVAGSPGTWANVVTTGLTGSTAGSTSSNHISADVTLTSASTYYDGPSLALNPGLWLLTSTTTYSGAAARVTAKLWDGTTTLDSAETTISGSSDVHAIALSGVVQPSSLTTYKVSAAPTGTGVSMRAAAPDNAAGNTASTLVAWSIANPNANFGGVEVTAQDFSATGLTGATAGARFAGATTSGAPGTGSFSTGDFVIDRTGTIWVCITGGSPGTWQSVSQNPSAVETAIAFAASGLPGAVTGSRYVGGVNNAPPATGTFLTGDFVVDITGKMYVCTSGGSPGTWNAVGQNPSAVATAIGFAATGLTGATAGTRYVGATASGAPTTGTFVTGDFTIDQTGKLWICTTGGAPGTWVQAGSSLGGVATATAFNATGLTGVTSGTRFVGATAVGGTGSGAPTTGTFVTGDFVIDQRGSMYVCWVGGSPGLWIEVGSVIHGPAGAISYNASGFVGASAGARFVGGTTSGPPVTGSFSVGDLVVDRTGQLWLNTVAGSPGTFVQIGATLGAESSATDYAPSGLTGATAASRYVGATNTGSPGSGTFVAGDWIADRTGRFWMCTTAGSPGTWTQIAGGGGGGGSSVGGNSAVSAVLGADVTLTAINTFYDGPSVTLPPGTWEIIGYGTISTSATGYGQIKIWDGVNAAIASGETFLGANSYSVTVTATALVTPTVTTTYKLSAAENGAASGLLKATTPHNALPAATQILAIPVGTSGALQTTVNQGSVIPLYVIGPIGGPQASITFTGISQSYRHLRLDVVARSDAATTSANVSVQINGDTGANYYSQISFANTGTGNITESLAGTSGLIGTINAATAPASVPGQLEVRFDSYSNSSFFKTWRGNGVHFTGNATGNQSGNDSHGRWNNAAQMNTLVLTPSAGNFAAGSYFALWGESDLAVATYQGGTILLASFAAPATSDFLSAFALTSGSWIDITGTSLSFTVSDPGAQIMLDLSGVITLAGTANQSTVRAMVDTAPTGVISGTSTLGESIISGGQIFPLGLLSAGPHTVKLQAYASGTGTTLNCRTSTAPNLESLQIAVLQQSGTAGGANTSNLFNRTAINNTGNKTATANTWTAVDGTNLPPLGVYANRGDIIRCVFTGQGNSGSAGLGFDFNVVQPTLGTTRLASATGEGVTAIGGGNRTVFHAVGLWNVAETGTHTFQPYFNGVNSSSGATIYNSSAGAQDDTELLFTIDRVYSNAAATVTSGTTTLATFVPPSSSDYMSAFVTSTTYTSLPSMPISFSVTDATADIVLELQGVIDTGTSTNYAFRYQLDGSTNSLPLTGGGGATGNNALQGVRVSLGSLAPGGHTIAIQAWSSAGGTLNCRTATQQSLESFRLTVRQVAQQAQPSAIVTPASNLFQQTKLRNTGNKTTTSNSFVAIDTTNLPPLSLTLLAGDSVRNTLYCQAAGNGTPAFDFAVVQPSLGTTRTNSAAVYGAAGIGGGNRTPLNVTALFTAAENGAHTFQPLYRNDGTNTLTVSNASGGTDDTEILYTVERVTSVALGAPPGYGTIEIIFDGIGVALTTGVKGDVRIDANLTIVGWGLYADTTGSAVVDIWKTPFASFPPTVTNTITGSALPTLSSAAHAEGASTALTGWTTSITQGDVLRFNINSASTITRLTVSLQVARR